MKLTLELYGKKCSVEEAKEDINGNELKALFSRLMFVAGFSPTSIECEDGGRYEYLEEDEYVAKRENVEEAEIIDQEETTES